MRQRTLWLTAAGTFLLVLVATLPASLVAPRLGPGVVLEGAYGSVFSGGADSLVFQGAPLGAVRYSFRPLALLSLTLGYHVELDGARAHARGDVALGASGTIGIDQATFDLPLAAVAGGNAAVASAARIGGEIRHARLSHGWPDALDATLRLSDVQPAMLPRPIGAYEVRFPGTPAANGVLRGALKDLPGAALGVEGTIDLKPDRTYAIGGTLTTRPATPPEVLPALDALGPAGADGRRPFSIGGTV